MKKESKNPMQLSFFRKEARILSGPGAEGDSAVSSECITLEGYQWYGSNHKLLTMSRRAMRGIGILVKDSLSESYSISIVDAEVEGIMWVQFVGKDGSEDCSIIRPLPIPLEGIMSNEFFDHLTSIFSLQCTGTFCICGYFNARCGSLKDICKDSLPDIPHRVVTDTAPPNRYGKSMINYQPLYVKW